ncbi:zf-TFIIB domain-containing protein [Haloferula sp.]|uniref:TFIIB-type zinc ribbon-containing protein n=1 Tax=Haloferula sp. TaxID=2497595 RepID=UPI003AF8C9ED
MTGRWLEWLRWADSILELDSIVAEAPMGRLPYSTKNEDIFHLPFCADDCSRSSRCRASRRLRKMKTYQCPIDSATLATNEVEAYLYCKCSQCHGIFLPGLFLDRVLTASGSRGFQIPEAHQPTSRSCPDCSESMVSFEISSITLDSCPECRGVWLDAGEALALSKHFAPASEVIRAEMERTDPKSDSAVDGLLAIELLIGVLSIFGD